MRHALGVRLSCVDSETVSYRGALQRLGADREGTGAMPSDSEDPDARAVPAQELTSSSGEWRNENSDETDSRSQASRESEAGGSAPAERRRQPASRKRDAAPRSSYRGTGQISNDNRTPLASHARASSSAESASSPHRPTQQSLTSNESSPKVTVGALAIQPASVSATRRTSSGM